MNYWREPGAGRALRSLATTLTRPSMIASLETRFPGALPPARRRPRLWVMGLVALLATGVPAQVGGPAGADELRTALEAFSGEWRGEIRIHALDGYLLKTFPATRTYGWQGDEQVVETRFHDGDAEYLTRARQSIRLGRLHAEVARPGMPPERYNGALADGAIAWTNTERNSRDYRERVAVRGGVRTLEATSAEIMRLKGVSGLVRVVLALESPRPATPPEGATARAAPPLEIDDRALEAARLEAARLLAEREAAAGELAATRAELERVSTAFAQTQRDNETLVRRVETLEGDAAAARTRADDLARAAQATAGVARDDRAALEAVAADTRDRLERALRDGEAALRLAEAARLERDALAGRLAATERAASERASSTEVADLQARLAGLQRSADEARQAEAAARESLERRLATAEAGQATFAQKLAAAERTARERVTEVSNSLAETRADLARREESLAGATRRLEQAVAERAALEARVEALQRSADEGSRNGATARDEARSLAAANTTLLARVAELEARDTTLTELQSRYERAEGGRLEAIARIGELEVRLRERERSDLSDGETAALRERIARLEGELSTAKAETGRERAGRETLAATVAERERLAGTAREDLARLRAELEVAKRRIDEADGRIRQAEGDLVAMAAVRAELRDTLALAEARRLENEKLLARTRELEARPAPRPASTGVFSAAEWSAQVEKLERRVLELESDRNTTRGRTDLLEAQLAEAKQLRDETLARFQDVVAQLNAAREERDRLARGAGAARSIDAVIAGFTIAGASRVGGEERVILDGRPYRAGDVVDPALGLVFARLDAEAIVFRDATGREYRRRP